MSSSLSSKSILVLLNFIIDTTIPQYYNSRRQMITQKLPSFFSFSSPSLYHKNRKQICIAFQKTFSLPPLQSLMLFGIFFFLSFFYPFTSSLILSHPILSLPPFYLFKPFYLLIFFYLSSLGFLVQSLNLSVLVEVFQIIQHQS